MAPGAGTPSLGVVVDVPLRRFERLVSEALDAIPDELAELIDNVVVTVEDQHPDDPDLLGVYLGVPLTERHDYGALAMPDRIVIFRRPICAVCDDEDDVFEEVMVTVVHEVAHHFGIDDATLDALGWD